MERPNIILAELENFGRIHRCGNCDNIHVQIGPVSLSLSVDAYMQLVAMMNTSAANFERMLACPEWDDQ